MPDLSFNSPERSALEKFEGRRSGQNCPRLPGNALLKIRPFCLLASLHSTCRDASFQQFDNSDFTRTEIRKYEISYFTRSTIFPA